MIIKKEQCLYVFIITIPVRDCIDTGSKNFSITYRILERGAGGGGSDVTAIESKCQTVESVQNISMYILYSDRFRLSDI